MKNLLILNYHSIYNTEYKNHVDPIYSIEEKFFRQQLRLIKKLDLTVVLIKDIHTIKSESRSFISITFDDAHDSDFISVYPILEEFGLKATFYLPTNKLKDNPEKTQQYQEMIKDGHAIGPHGKTHTYLTDLNFMEQYQELKDSKEVIENISMEAADYFSLPGGKYNRGILDIASKLGYKGLLTTNFGFTDLEKEHFLLKRWIIKKSTSIKTIEKVLQNNRMEIKKEEGKTILKKWANRLFSDQTIDKLNYKLRG